MTDTDEKLMTQDERNRMNEDLQALAKQWHDDGISGSSILAFIMKASADTAEYAGVTYDIAVAVIDRAYGKDNLLRPNAKA